MTNFDALFEQHNPTSWTRKSPASRDDIEALERFLPPGVPEEYLEFLQYSDGADGEIPVQPYWCILYSARDVITQFSHPIYSSLSEFFPIGTNGGGEFLCFKTTDKPWSIYVIPFPYDNAKYALSVACDFIELLRMLGKQEESPDTDGSAKFST